MTTTIKVRPARPEEAQFLFEVYASTRGEELAMVPWSEEQKQAFLRMQFQAQDQHYKRHFPAAEFQIIEIDQAPAGRIYVDRASNPILLLDIALLPQFQKAGIGTRLLKSLLEEASRAGRAVQLHVEQFNRAMGLYRRLGFKEVGQEGIHHRLEWRAEIGPSPVVGSVEAG